MEENKQQQQSTTDDPGARVLACALKSKYCIGDSLTENQDNKTDFASPLPVKICFNLAENKKADFISFPIQEENNNNNNTTTDCIQSLLDACSTATFGVGAREVEDPQYRKALALDSSRFVTNFHPANYGILDQVRNLIAPQCEGIHAEPYKLNVYPEGGHFKAHRDTPRGASMIGSLVVCLPNRHEGGALVVRRGEVSHTFDFSASDPSFRTIQWAAFYSDCEHEILPVTKGFRITLTYNLYSTAPGTSVVRSMEETELYKVMKSIYDDKTFLPNGGQVAVMCTHDYSNSSLAAENPAEILKGADALLHSAAKALGLRVSIKALYEVEKEVEEEEEDEDEEEDEEESERERKEREPKAKKQKVPKYEYELYRTKYGTLMKKILFVEDVPQWPCSYRDCIGEEIGLREFFESSVRAKILPTNVTWWGKRSGTNILGIVTSSYGNQPSTKDFYFKVVMLFDWPSQD